MVIANSAECHLALLFNKIRNINVNKIFSTSLNAFIVTTTFFKL